MGSRVVPFFCDRKRLVTTPFTEYLDNDMIKRGPHIMNGISDNERNLGWRRADRFHINEALPGIRVDIGAETVEITLKKGLEGGFKLLDVAVGPLNL